MKSLYLTFDDTTFKKLKKAKEDCAKKRKQRISWEDFVLIKLIDAVI